MAAYVLSSVTLSSLIAPSIRIDVRIREHVRGKTAFPLSAIIVAAQIESPTPTKIMMKSKATA